MIKASHQAAEIERIGPGRLVLVVGPSGAGKDTLLKLAAPLCGSDVVFPKRAVTRAASESEENESLSRAEFDAQCAAGAFALQWDAHGLRYGVRHAMDDELRGGRAVVVNVSRAIVEETRARYRNVVVVLITAPPEDLARRLAQRERVSDGSLDDRLSRSVAIDAYKPDVTIVNVGDVAERARELVRAIRG